MALRLMPDGTEKFERLPYCTCEGTATKRFEGKRLVGWTDGPRGPPGGVCGACGGEIKRATDKE